MPAKAHTHQRGSERPPPVRASDADSKAQNLSVHASSSAPGANLRSEESIEELRAAMRYVIGSKPLLEEDVRTGKVVIGRLRIYSSYATGLAFVSSPRFPCDIVIHSVKNRNNAQHGDIVAVKLIDKDDWADAALVDSSHDDTENTEENSPDMDNSDAPDTLGLGKSKSLGTATRWVRDSTKYGDGRAEVQLAHAMGGPATYDWEGMKPHGVVLATLQRKCKLTAVAHLWEGALGPNDSIALNRFYHFQCSDPLLPHIAVYGRDIPQIMQPQVRESFFLVLLLTNPDGDFVFTEGKLLTGRIVRLLGGMNSVRANSAALCAAFKVSTTDFSDEANDCIPDTFEIPDAAELRRMGRRDLREEEFVCSIDPSTARDLDDALSIARVPSGYRVGVHIADVSYFVPVGSPLDEEAQTRSTSVYLVEKVVNMLPRKLSEEYCSLNTSSDKFAFSCIFHFDHHGKLQSEWFGQSVIRNRCCLSYEEAQCIIDGDSGVLEAHDFGSNTPQTDELRARIVESVICLHELASKIRSATLARGRLTIGNTTIRLNFEDIAKPTLPIGFGISRQKESNWVVEEFMLLANRRTAEKILEYLPDQALLRKHDLPDKEKAKIFSLALTQINIELHGTSSKALQDALNKAKSSPEYDSLCCMTKFFLKRALYCVKGCEGEAFCGHYALAMPWYTHFTSPIRRYCDIIAHRQLLCALEVESIVKKHHNVTANSIDVDELVTRDFFYTVSEVESIVENANAKKLNARCVSSLSSRFFFCQYLDTLKRISLANKKPFVPRVSATVIRILPNEYSFTVFVGEVAQEVVVKLNDKSQRFETQSTSAEDESVNKDLNTPAARSDTHDVRDSKRKARNPNMQRGSTTNVNIGSDTAKDYRQGNHQKGTKEKKDIFQGNEKFVIHWGLHPLSREDVTEEIAFFSNVTGVFATKRVKGYMDLDIIVDPPWERKNPCNGIPTVLPV